MSFSGGGSNLPKETEVSRMLERLREEPINTQGSQDAILAPIYTLLMSASPSEDGILHWFCDEARPVVVEASTFLLRLHAYSDNVRVDAWKTKLAGVLHGCCSCMQGYMSAKVSSRDTYFAAFSKHVLDSFFSTIEKWELCIVLAAIKDAGISSGSKKSFSDLPAPILYHVLLSISFFESPELLYLLQEHPPAFISLGWPTAVPPGLLLLLFHKKTEIRAWAQQQMVGCSPIDKDKFVDSYEVVFQSVATALTSGAHTPLLQPDTNHTPHRPLGGYFTMPPSALWSGLQGFLRALPINLMGSENRTARAIRHAIIGHLHDKGSHFPDVLRAFIYLIKKQGRSLWQGEGHDYPQVVFDSIKDNVMYLRLIQDSESNPIQQPWFVEWFQVYLNSLSDMPVFGEMLMKIVGFTCEELQHERFADKRPSIMACILAILDEVVQSTKADSKSKALSVINYVLDIHADVIIGVALSPKRNTPSWHAARAAARQLLDHALRIDASHSEAVIFQISDVVQQHMSSSGVKRKYNLKEPTFHGRVWKNMYDTVGNDDSEGLILLISLVAHSAHLDTLSLDAFNPSSLPAEIRQNIGTVIVAVNAGLHVIRAGFLDAITQYTSTTSSTSKVMQSLLRRPGTTKYLLALLISPVEELQMASQILLGQAYDVDLRSDCLRAILKDLPAAALDGIATAVSTFNDCAPLFPEACSFAKSLVRCMTDVIEVLTNGRDGLLFDSHFGGGSETVQLQARLLKLWRLMCDAITTIFRRTPTWSKVNEPEVLIDWMRDALIFARDLVAQRRTFEAAALLLSQQSRITLDSPRKPSQIGRDMLNDLQSVLMESIRWLRLTDMELLHQSSNLVQTLLDCFRETGVNPSQDSLARLEKFLDASRRKSIPESQQTRLSETHLSELATALSFFNQDDDDDIQIIGETKPPVTFDSTSDRAESSRTYSNGLRQRKLDSFLTASSKHSVKTSSGFRSTPFVDIQRGGKSLSQSSSLMAQVRSQAAAQGLSTVSGRSRLIERPERSAKLSREGPNLKGETLSTKSGVLQPSSSSSSSSESDDDGGPGGLASLGKLQKSPLIKKTAQRRTVKLMETEFTGRNAALDRVRKREEAQRAALRMKPDLQPLHRTILSWDYDHDGLEPPVLGDRPSYVPIMDQFESDQEYQRIFEPLLTLECWSQLIKSKEEVAPETLTCKINSRQYIDDWLDLDVSVADRPPERWWLAETDILLLRKLGCQNSILAKVQSSSITAFQTIQATLRSHSSPNAPDPGLYVNTEWRIIKVFSLSTIAREYAALKALPYYDLSAEIMKPRLIGIPHLPAAQVEQAMKAYHVNEPQAVAILGSMQTDGFSLVQGPPGTGKTSTICGIVGAFLSMRARPATFVQAGRSYAPPEKLPPIKMLICAPSNAAIDEVARRLKNGVRNSEGRLVVPTIVRVGADKAINTSVKDISLDQLVDQRLNSDPKQASASSAPITMGTLRTEMDVLRNTRATKLQELTNLRDNVFRAQALELELKSLNSQRMLLSQQLNRIKDQQKSDSRTLDAARRKYRVEVLMDADIICSTLSGAGHEVLENLDFEIIVIDEAAQSVELSSLIPLKYRSKRCIMVGDPQQLPPTVLSPLANKFGYGQSLFVRLQKNSPDAVHLLSIQYRMHPDISRLPSTLFYAQRLVDGPGMAEKTCQIWHKHPLFGTYKFINVASGNEQPAHGGHSLINRTECEVAVALYNRIRTEYTDVDLDYRIGVITMYRAQLLELKKKFQVAFGADVVDKVDFNTVDGFQGQEKDIIILSCVRAGPGVQSIGFLTDQRRLNVAITRARASLFILGHVATLERSDEIWKAIVQDARSTSRLLDAEPSTYRRPLNLSTPPLHAVKSLPTSNPVVIPDDLKTPKELAQSRPQSIRPVGTPTSANSGPSNTTIARHTMKLADSTMSSIHKKLQNSDDTDTHRRPSSLRDKSDPQDKPLPHPPPPKKRPKEVSMFIPKKKPDLKRAAPRQGNPSQGDTKRRVTDRYYD